MKKLFYGTDVTNRNILNCVCNLGCTTSSFKCGRLKRESVIDFWSSKIIETIFFTFCENELYALDYRFFF